MPDLCGYSRRGFSPGTLNGTHEAPPQQMQPLQHAQGLLGSCLWALAKTALHPDAKITQGASLRVRLAATALAPILNAQVGYCRDVH